MTEVRMIGRGLRGESFADVARRLAEIGGLAVGAGDTDAAVMDTLVAAAGNGAAAIVDSASRVFMDDLGSPDAYARRFFRFFKVERADGQAHVYYLNYETLSFGGPTYRIRFYLWDATDNVKVAQIERTAASLVAIKALFPADGTFTMAQAAVGSPIPGGYSGITATGRMDWAQVDWTKALTAYTDAAHSGIHPLNIVTNAQMDDFLDHATPAVILTVGASGANFTTVRGAVESLYDPDVGTVTYTTDPLSQLCSYSNQVLIQVIDDNHTEDVAGLIIPDFLTIRGLGMGNTVLTATGVSPALTPRVVEATHSFRFERLTLKQLGRGYIAHHDAGNVLSIRATHGVPVLHHRDRGVYCDCELIAGASSQETMIGTGHSNGLYLLFDACRIKRLGTNTNAFILDHNIAATTDPGTLHLRNCWANDGAVAGSNGAVQLITSDAQAFPHQVIIENSQIGKVDASNTSGGGAAFVRQGGPWAFTYPGALDPA